MGAGEDASPHFLSRPNDGKAPSSQRLTEAASESGRVRVPYLTAALAPFLPQRPHPLQGLRPGSRKAGDAPRRGRNRGAAAAPAGAGRLCSCRSDSLRWNRPRSPPARSALPQPCFHPRSLPREAGLAVQNGRRLLAPTAISLTPLAPLPVGPRPRMSRYRFRQPPLIISCWYKKRRKSRVRAESRKRRFFNLKANFYFRLLKAEGHQERVAGGW